VVAGEVRSLAQKSAEAAKDIKALIGESVARIDEGTRLASQSGEVLQGINQSIDGVADMINQIAQASSEQSEGIKQVHNAIAQIDGVTQQNAALVEETSAASESLSEQARILQQDMAFFNTGMGQSSPRGIENKPKVRSQNQAARLSRPAKTEKPVVAVHSNKNNEWSEF
jgi:methyl-accepting chemotaxis protein